jgi:hypothetical protein
MQQAYAVVGRRPCARRGGAAAAVAVVVALALYIGPIPRTHYAGSRVRSGAGAQ